MKYLHYEFNVGPEDIIKVTLNKQANVRLLDSSNYSNYKNGKAYKYNGGLAVRSPINMSPPHQGYWHLVIDLEGYTGSVTASVNIIRK